MCWGGVSAGAGGDDIVGVIGHRHGLRHPDAVADMHGADVGSQQDGLQLYCSRCRAMSASTQDLLDAESVTGSSSPAGGQRVCVPG